MQKWISWITAMFTIFGLALAANADSPALSATPMVEMRKDAAVSITGKGFTPGTEVAILFTDANGVTADIEAGLDPKPVVNDKGEFSTVWNCGRYISRKLIKAGLTTITVADGDYNLLAHDSIAFLPAAAPPPAVEATQVVKMSKDATVTISGTGFDPGQEIAILFTDPNGITASLESYLDPIPVSDSAGKWSTTWKCGRYISKKFIKPGVTTIAVTDSDYNLLAHASVAFLTD